MAAPSSFCWGAHDPPTPKALRTLATHIVAYPWNGAIPLPLREWGNTVLYLGLEGRTSSNLSHRQAALHGSLLARAQRPPVRSARRRGDASVPWLSLTPDATTAAVRGARRRRPTCSCRRTLRTCSR